MTKKLEKFLSPKILGGDFERIYDCFQRGDDCLLFGLNYAPKAHILSQSEKFLLYVVKDSTVAIRAYEALSDYYDSEEIVFLPEKDDVLVYRKAFQSTQLATRIEVLDLLAKGKIKCCIVTAMSLMQYMPLRKNLTDAVISVRTGEDYNIYDLCEKLVKAGYHREAGIEEKGTFCLAGDILSVYPPNKDLPFRISFWGDTIESIKTFEPDTMMTVSTVNEVNLLPGNDLLVDFQTIENAVESAKAKTAKLSATAYDRVCEILQELQQKQSVEQSHQWLLPFIRKYQTNILDYVPANALIAFDEPSVIYEKMLHYEQETIERVKSLAQQGEVLKDHDNCIIPVDIAVEALQKFSKVGLAQLPSTNKIITKPLYTFSPRNLNVDSYTLNIKQFYTDSLNYVRAGYCVIVCMGDIATAKGFAQSLYEEDVPCNYQDDAEEWQNTVIVTPIEIKHGYCYPQNRLVIIGKKDLLKGSSIKSASSKTRVFTLPKVGDYVVHEVHGIGRCIGTERIKSRDIERDFVVIEYADGGLLQVPIDQMDRLSRYSGSDKAPKLSKLGGKDFEKVKSKVVQSIKKMAINLVEIYAKRHKAKGYTYPEDTLEQKRFEDSFPYDETPDQIRAINEIKTDMQKGRVMDRLLCGDVGYGKTEVALRAVFKTVMELKQCAFLAPTTILATQHYNTAKDRFEQFGIGIELFTRFKSKEEIATSLKNIKEGKSLVAIGTHRLLSKDVEFADLGLIVQDEEQRFGVEHKEKMKLLKSDVNVLTLSATPIPRTLNMALTGIRDISVLETPPSTRIPVQTYVTEFTDALVQDAVRRELARGGQVFILYNRVDTIDLFASKIAKIVPEAKIVVGHGQMDSVTLENNMQTFLNKTANVLVSTTIIENGIDVPDANTLIVCDADRLGLSQLYQLRGRVGRRNRIAYAYFTTGENKILSSDAVKRLKAIMDYTEFGSGFKIAMRDLEIRGAGNVLGREQHGHIEKVGYDLYCKLLAKCVEELQGETSVEDADIDVSIAVNAYLDSRYVSDVDARLKIYRTMADLCSVDETLDFIDRLRENYGDLPKPLINLINIAFAKNCAKKIGVKKIVVQDKIAELVFADPQKLRNQRLFEVLEEMKDYCSLSAGEQPKIVFDCKHLQNDKKFALVCEFLTKSIKTF